MKSYFYLALPIAVALLSTELRAEPAEITLGAPYAPAQPLVLKYEPGTRDRSSIPQLTKTCRVRVLPVEDTRQNTATIGDGFPDGLWVDGVSAWLSDALRGLEAYGYKVSVAAADASGASTPADVTVRTRLTRAYVWPFSMKIFGVVALHASYSGPNGTTSTYYRALGDKANINGAKTEFLATMNYAVNNLQHAMADDLQALCKGQIVEPFRYAGPDEPLQP